MTDPALYPCFLGPYGENNELLERLVIEFLRDHVYWRRNVHPEDPPVIPTNAALMPEYQAFSADLRRELHSLSAALKRSVPFHSPRYLGHMVSDLLLPGLLAQIVTLPYNPNNVVGEASPVTLDMEISAGLQLARMLGYRADENRADCAFGYLTSGGTTANYQALRQAQALKWFAPALAGALRTLGEDLPCRALPDAIRTLDDWTLGNLSPGGAIDLLAAWRLRLSQATAGERAAWQRALSAERFETLGATTFFQRHPQLAEAVVLVPVTAHYSWPKAMKLLGLGTTNLIAVPEQGMRLDAAALEERLDTCLRSKRPVLMSVAVLGTTEFGTIDPVHRVIGARDASADRGLGHWVHVDAAWGGYLATLFRATDGSLLPRDKVGDGFAQFPSSEVYEAFAALSEADSITVDPHKLGYLPYGAGAFICRDHRAMELLAEDADYVFGTSSDNYRKRFRNLGRYILEGSKSGAAAAAVYVTHKVLPLDREHFGRIPQQTVRSAEYFEQAIARFAERVADIATVCLPFLPDSNLVCIAINARGNRDIAAMRVLIERLYDQLRVAPGQPIQQRAFFGSITTLKPDTLGAIDYQRVLDLLGLDPPNADQDGRLLILRHTLMNPFLRDDHGGTDYLELYLEHLETLLREALKGSGVGW